MSNFTKLALILGLAALPGSAVADTAEDEVLHVVMRFFEGLSTADGEVWREILHDRSAFFAHRLQEDGTWALSDYAGSERADSLADNTVTLDERIYNPTVLVRGPVAVVWAPYDIAVDGELSHCGIDVFNLVQVEGVWKITNLTYTTEPDACDALGIPARSKPED